jgi:two-component system, OmpR family, response regulator MtrA
MSTTVSKPRVLIIDDDPSLRFFLQMLFEHDGFDVSLADKGGEGVKLALMNPPGIIILDIMMEGLNGFEVCKILRADTSMRRTAIIMISGKSYKPDIDKAMELGADSYIIKPYSPEELLTTAVKCMHERANLPS